MGMCSNTVFYSSSLSFLIHMGGHTDKAPRERNPAQILFQKVFSQLQRSGIFFLSCSFQLLTSASSYYQKIRKGEKRLISGSLYLLLTRSINFSKMGNFTK